MFACWCLVCRRRPDKVRPKTIYHAGSDSLISNESGSLRKESTLGLGGTGTGLGVIFETSIDSQNTEGKSVEESRPYLGTSFRTIEEYH
jgi:hypothetical protein